MLVLGYCEKTSSKKGQWCSFLLENQHIKLTTKKEKMMNSQTYMSGIDSSNKNSILMSFEPSNIRKR